MGDAAIRREMKVVDHPAHEPNPELVNLLEKVLESAKSGELRSVAITEMWNDRSVSQCWALDTQIGFMPMVGGLESLKLELLLNIDPEIQERIQSIVW